MKNYLQRFRPGVSHFSFSPVVVVGWRGADNALGPTGEYNGSITTAGSYDPYTGNAKRFVDDLTVTERPGRLSAQMDAGAEHPQPKSLVARLPMGPHGGALRALPLLRSSL